MVTRPTGYLNPPLPAGEGTTTDMAYINTRSMTGRVRHVAARWPEYAASAEDMTAAIWAVFYHGTFGLSDIRQVDGFVRSVTPEMLRNPPAAVPSLDDVRPAWRKVTGKSAKRRNVDRYVCNWYSDL